jgi:hypothetical protein
VNNRDRSAKLSQLRRKTDRDLARLISSRLARELAAGFADSAAQAYSEANTLLERIDYLPEAERAPLETALAELRRRFENRSQSSGMAA